MQVPEIRTSMKLSPSPLRSLVRLALPLAAAGGLLGASAGLTAPAQAAAVRPAAFTWHAFKLINGWQSASVPLLVTGTPAWALHDGVIYLRGAVKNPASSVSEEFARLPVQARPARTLYLEDYSTAEAPGSVRIGSDGSVNAFGASSTQFTALGNISFPLGSITPHKLALKNGWVSENSQYGTGDPAYSVSGGVVYLSGSMASGKVGWAAVVLPKAARPAHVMYVLVYTYAGAAGLLTINPNGKVVATGSGAHGYTSLAGISYPVASTKWHNFTLTASWKSADSQYHTGSPAYVVINGVVYVGGGLTGTKALDGLWTELPAAIQPSTQVFAEVDAGGTFGSVDFAQNYGIVNSSPVANSMKFTSLAALEYPPSA